MPTADCPYCGSDTFTNDVIRADAPSKADPAKHAAIYGHWFNQCADCGDWSMHRNGKQISIAGKNARPKEHSRASVK